MFYTQDINPTTGDISFNPAAFGLSMKDLDSVTAIKNKVAVSSGMIALTAEEYRAVEHLVQSKYAGLDVGGFFDSTVLPAVDMTGKDPGLYMTQQYLGYYDGTNWRSYIGNTGHFYFKGNNTNFIQWNGSALEIQGVLRMTDGTTIEDYVANNTPEASVMVNSTFDSTIGKYRQWLNTGDLSPYSIPNGSQGVYITNQGLFGVQRTGPNSHKTMFSILNNGDAFFRGTIGADAIISGSATIDGSTTLLSVNNGATKANNALDANNQYKNWLNSSIMSTAQQVGTGVVMGSQGILGFKNNVKMFEINTDSGDAFFRGNIYAESGTFAGSITSNATITGGIIQTALPGNSRIILEQQGLATYIGSNNFPSIRIYGKDIYYHNDGTGNNSIKQYINYITANGNKFPVLNFENLVQQFLSAISTSVVTGASNGQGVRLFVGYNGYVSFYQDYGATGPYNLPTSVYMSAPSNQYELNIYNINKLHLSNPSGNGSFLQVDGKKLYWGNKLLAESTI